MWERLFGVRDSDEEDIQKKIISYLDQALYHENEARKCENELRRLISYPSIYRDAYRQSLLLIDYHREQARICKEKALNETSLS